MFRAARSAKRRVVFPLVLAAFLAFPAAVAWGANVPAACQIAVLRNGFTIDFAQRGIVGQATRLWLCAGAATDYVEIPTEQIESFEQRPTVPALPTMVPAVGAPTIAIKPVSARESIERLIATTAQRHLIDPDFVVSVVKEESGFNPAAVSPKGAAGLMQLMPETAAHFGVKNVLDAAANIEGGTRFLRQLLDQYNGDAVKALAAFNAGPQTVELYGGIPPFPETRAYVTRIIEDFNRKKLQQQAQANAAPAGK